MIKLFCKIFDHWYDNHSYWDDRLKVNIPDYKCRLCGKESEWSKKEKKYFEEHACDICGAWVCDSGICRYC